MTAYFCNVDIHSAAKAAAVRFDLGSGMHLRLDERRIADREIDRRIDIALTGATIDDDVDAVYVRGSVAGTVLDADHPASPDLVCNHTWDGSVDGTAHDGSLRVDLRIGRRLKRRFPFPNRTSWWDRTVSLGRLDARGIGLGGLTPQVHHRLEPDAAVLWLGTGRRLDQVEVRPAPGDGDLLAVEVGNLTHVFDRAGRHRYTSDRTKGEVRVICETDEVGRLTAWRTRSGEHHRVEHTADTQVVIYGPAGNWATVDLDSLGRISQVTSASGSTATVSYETTGLISEVKAGDDVTTLAHGPDGTLHSWQRSTGQRVDLVEEVQPRLRRTTLLTSGGREQTSVSERLPDGSRRSTRHCCGAEAPTIVTTNPIERRTERPDGSVTVRRSTTIATRDGSETHERTMSRSPAGRVSTVRTTRRVGTNGIAETTEIDGQVWTRTLDRETRTVSSTTPEGRMTAHRVTPGSGLHAKTSGGPEVVTQVIDGRPSRITVGSAVTDLEYDEHGRVSALTADGVRRRITHDVAGRIVAQELSDGWLELSYDTSNRLSSYSTPNGATTTFDRAADGLVTTMQVLADDRSVRTTHYEYDTDRTLVAEITEGGPEVRMTLDPVGRVSAVASTGVDIEVAHDAASGRPSRVTSGGVTVELGYDGSALVAETLSGDAEGSVTHVLGPSGLELERVIDGVGLPIERDRDGLPVVVGPVRLVRGQADAQIQRVLAGNATTDYTYDANGDLVAHSTSVGGDIVFAEQITRDQSGRIVAVIESGRDGQKTLGYTYDDAGRLLEATSDGGVVLAVSFDPNGNTAERRGPAGTVVATHDPADRLISHDTTPALHGPSGELTRLGNRTFGYDGLGRLASVIDADGADVEHRHDGFGRRIEWQADDSTYLRVTWSGASVAAYRDDLGRHHRCVNAGIGEAPEVILSPDRTMRLVTDHRGSVRQVIDADTGETLQVLDYDAYGRRALDSDPGCQPFGFTGALHDPYTGLVHLRARDLDPKLGRFLSPDPLGIDGGQTNLYQYAAGDPINRTDPSGTQSSGGGGVSVCTTPFIGSRPLSIDHVFIKTKEWSRGATYGPDAQGLDRWMQEWVDEKTHPNASDVPGKETECQPVENVDEECLDKFTKPGTGAGPYGVGLKFPIPFSPLPIEPNACYTEVWDALDACAGDGGWSYSDDVDRVIGEGPGVFETAGRWARDALNYPGTIWHWVTH